MEKKLTFDFFIIGAQKSASTWLYRCLKEHPEIFLPEKKLDKNYIGSEWFQKEGSEWFEEQYKNCLLYTSPSPRDATLSRMPSSA